MLYHIYSGHLFFSALAALALVVIADATGRLDRTPPFVSALRVAGLSSLALTTFSGAPITLWLAVPSLIVGVAYVLGGIGAPKPRRIAMGALTLVASVGCVAVELPYHLRSVRLHEPPRIVVVGDSLSSGGFGESLVWPEVLGRRLQADVVNLSRPSDTAKGAVNGQLPDVPVARAGDLVFLEIGGNDMLEGSSASEFEDALATLAEALANDDRRVVMFELPLLPGRWGYGAAQRRVAKIHGITLIPKRVLAHAIVRPDNTYDGLHLTQRGHDALARGVAEWAGW